MSRQLSTVFASAITGSKLTVANAVDFEFGGATGTIRFYTGIGTLILNGNEYIGTGNIGSITSYTEDNKLGVNNMTFTLSGVPAEVLAIALNEQCRNKPCRMYMVLFNEAGNVMSSQICFTGRMDQMIVKEAGDNSIISITAESQVIDFNRPRLSRWVYNQRKDPSDNGLKYISRASTMVIPWGAELVYMNRNTADVGSTNTGVYNSSNVNQSLSSNYSSNSPEDLQRISSMLLMTSTWR